MQMTPGEIKRDYDAAINKKRQIGILADLNGCSRKEIEKILFGDSNKPTPEPVNETVVEPPQESADEPKEPLNLDSVQEVLYRRLDELNGQISVLEEEYRKVMIAIEVLGSVEKAGAPC